MYPNLRFAFYDIFGIDLPFLGLVQSYGFFLALSFVAAAWWLWVDFRRKEREGLMQGIEEQYKVGEPIGVADVVWNLLLGFLLGFKGVYAIMNQSAFTGDSAQANFLSWEHGNWIAGIVGALGFVGWKWWEKQQERKQYPEPQVLTRMVMPHERIGDIVILSAVSGVIGAKLLYLVEEWVKSDPPMTQEQLMKALFSGSGLAVYGGLIGGFVAVSYYIWKKKITYAHLLDSAAPSMILAYGVGRLGCHFSGDGDWGITATVAKPFSWLPDWMWAYKYPNNVINSSDHAHVTLTDCGGYPFGADMGYCTELAQPVYTTSVWEFFFGVIIFLILISLRRWARQGGLLFSIYLIFNGIERFSIETIRVNPDYAVGGYSLSQAQFIAIGLFVIGCICTAFFYLRQRRAA